MTAHTSVVCPNCKLLVEVVDKQIAEHNDCIASGMRYVPSPWGGGSFNHASGTRREVIAQFPVHLPPCCENHPGIRGNIVLVKETRPKAHLN